MLTDIVVRETMLLLTPDTLIAPVSRESLGDEATSRLRALILSGDISPGSRLKESGLCDLLAVSRGPVREALRNLEREGLVVIRPHRGAVVAEWSLEDLLDTYEVRTSLEVTSAGLATERSAEPCAERLRAILARWRVAIQRGDRGDCADLDLEFHRAIWTHAKSRMILGFLEQAVYPLHTVFFLNATKYDDLTEVWELHARLSDAIAGGDPEAAREAMRAHMKNSLEKARVHSRAGA